MTNNISQIKDAINYWWVFLITGLLLVFVSYKVITTPLESYVSLSILFSILVLVNGFFYTIFSITNHKQLDGWGWYLAGGIFDIAIGIILVLYPGISIVLLPVFIGFWLMFRGVSVIGTSLDLKKYDVLNWGWLMVLGILMTILAFFMVMDPLFGFLNIIYITSISFLVFGVISIIMAFKLKNVK